MNTTRVLLVAILLLLGACGENNQTPPAEVPASAETTATSASGTTAAEEPQPTGPEDSTSVADSAATITADDTAATGPTVTTEPPAPEQPDTTAETEKPDKTTTTTTTQVACPEGQHSHDGEPCHPDETLEPVQAPTGDGTETTIGDMTTQQTCETAGGVWDAEASTCNPTETGQEPTGDTSGVVYWRPTLHREALASVGTEHADYQELRHWPLRDMGVDELFSFAQHHVFHFYEPDGDVSEQHALFEDVYQHAGSAFVGEYLWYPYRFDVFWVQYPNLLEVTATYPLGKTRAVVVEADAATRRTAVVEDIPLPPPIRPTTPFAEPQWPEMAEGLGRDCPPVEEVWEGFGAEVTDPCTLAAVEQAVDWMWRGDFWWRQGAIRDGHAMSEWLLSIDELEDPYLRALMGYESRLNSGTLIRDVQWAGHFPGASMVYLEWNFGYVDRPFTPEEQAAKVRYYSDLADLGINVPPQYLGDEQTLGDIGWSWKRALVVRTADGTWRVSYRAVCYFYESRNMGHRERLLCPDDPNPHFPDSALFDRYLSPPNHPYYFIDQRATTPPDRTPHQDGGTPRLNDEYVGVPPS